MLSIFSGKSKANNPEATSSPTTPPNRQKQLDDIVKLVEREEKISALRHFIAILTAPSPNPYQPKDQQKVLDSAQKLLSELTKEADKEKKQHQVVVDAICFPNFK